MLKNVQVSECVLTSINTYHRAGSEMLSSKENGRIFCNNTPPLSGMQMHKLP